MKRFNKKLYALNLDKFHKQISKNYLKKELLAQYSISKGIILPLRKTELPATDGIYEGGVCNENFEFVAGYKRKNDASPTNFEIIRPYIPEGEIDYIDDDVIFAGIAFGHFGHFIVESFNRLWYVIKNNLFDKKIVFLTNQTEIKPFFKLIEYTGIKKENILFLEKPTQFKSVCIPEQSLCYFNFYHKEYTFPYEAIRKNIPVGNKKKIYLSRTQFRKKDVINEEYFEKFYSDMGYTIIYPEQLSIEEQISAISGADEIVSTIGTISHLALFAKKNARIITLLRARNYLNVPQIIINQAKDLDYSLVDVTCNILPHRYSINCYYIGPNSSWREFVKKEYGIEIEGSLLDYLNNEKTNIGNYFSLWLKTFSNKKNYSKVKLDNVDTLLDNIETALSDEEIEMFASKKLHNEFAKEDPVYKILKGKIMYFSRIDGSHKRIICLTDSGIIQTINGKGHSNEYYWDVFNNNLRFKSLKGEITSTFDIPADIRNTEKSHLSTQGVYLKNPKIHFKLEEL